MKIIISEHTLRPFGEPELSLSDVPNSEGLICLSIDSTPDIHGTGDAIGINRREAEQIVAHLRAVFGIA